MQLCAIVANASFREGVVCYVPVSLYPLLCPRKTQIAIGEMLAVYLAFIFYGKAFEQRSSICFVDNMGVIHTIVNGTSPMVDLGCFAQGIHRRLASLGATVWWEYVASASNISDGGSRVGIDCPAAREMGIPLRIVPFRLPPRSFPYISIADWDSWWSCM